MTRLRVCIGLPYRSKLCLAASYGDSRIRNHLEKSDSRKLGARLARTRCVQPHRRPWTQKKRSHLDLEERTGRKRMVEDTFCRAYLKVGSHGSNCSTTAFAKCLWTMTVSSHLHWSSE